MSTSIRIVISSPDFREMKGLSKTSGKPYHMRIQTAHAFPIDKDGVIGDFPDKFEIALDADQVPYPRGEYTLQPSAIYVSRDGKLSVSPRLVARAAAPAKS